MLRREFILNALKAAGITLSAGAPLAELLALPAAAASAPNSGAGSIPYGAAVRDDPLATEPDYAAAIIAHCRWIVGEGGLKWADVRPARDQFVFGRADGQLAFARAHGMEMRGHNLVWYAAMPDWTKEIGSAAEAEYELTRHIQTVMARYAGRIRSWDVINEPIPDDPATPADLRPSIWQERLGTRYLALALRTAAAVDPAARLTINEYDVEFAGDRFRRKREALLHLIRSLKDDDVPLHAVGLQGHLRGDAAIDRDGLSAFVAEVHALGLDVLITELDVIDDRLPGPPLLRDAMVAARAHDFLAAVRAAARPAAILTWGITDKYTWVPIWFKRRDGLPNRPLPLDADYRPKPLMQVIELFARDAA
jgi:endo-1,4-beta-xylanase